MGRHQMEDGFLAPQKFLAFQGQYRVDSLADAQLQGIFFRQQPRLTQLVESHF